MTPNVPEALWVGVVLFGLRFAWTTYREYQDMRAGKRLADYVTRIECNRLRSGVVDGINSRCALCSDGVQDRLKNGDNVFESLRRDREWTRAALALLLRRADVSPEEIEAEIKMHAGGDHG